MKKIVLCKYIFNFSLPTANMAADDLFSQLFGGGLFGMGMGGGRRRKRGEDTIYPLK